MGVGGKVFAQCLVVDIEIKSVDGFAPWFVTVIRARFRKGIGKKTIQGFIGATDNGTESNGNSLLVPGRTLRTSGFTMASSERYHAKETCSAHVLGRRNVAERGSASRRFVRPGLGDYFQFDSVPLSVAPKSPELFFPDAFPERARITVTNQGAKPSTLFISISTTRH